MDSEVSVDVAAEVTPREGEAQQAARALQRLGFRVLHVGTTISVEGHRALWASVFAVTFQDVSKKRSVGGHEDTVTRARPTSEPRIPLDLQALVTDIAFPEPPDFF